VPGDLISDERYYEMAEGLRQELAATLAVYGSAGSRFRDPIIAALRAAVAEATAALTREVTELSSLLADAEIDALPWVAAERGEAARWLRGEVEAADRRAGGALDESFDETYHLGRRDGYARAADWLEARGTAEPLPPGRAREAADRRLVLLREVRRLWGRPEPGVVDLLERIEKEVEGG
jgi:hypothetical protein